MPWSDTSTMEQRKSFIRDWLRERTIASLCEAYDISRPTAYKWIERFQSSGEAGLEDRSRRPEHSPMQTPGIVQEALVALRRAHPTWGPKKLVVLLSRQHPQLRIPAASTAGAILERAGLVKPRRMRSRPSASSPPGGRGIEPNDVWCFDYKGQFRLRSGIYCYPLTVTDEFSRSILECRGFAGIRGDDVQASCLRLFHDHGLPRRIRCDNGSPFASTGAARLSRLSVWWMRLGILMDRSQPHRPDQNGCHERMHRDLKAETTRPPEATLRAQQRRFDEFCRCHNEVRPHEALGMTTPAEHYAPSPRKMPARLPPMEYPGHAEVRRVDSSGCTRFRGACLFISNALAGEDIGLLEVDDGHWAVSFASLRLGTFNARTGRFSATCSKAKTQSEPNDQSRATAPFDSLPPVSDAKKLGLKGPRGVENRRPSKAAITSTDQRQPGQV